MSGQLEKSRKVLTLLLLVQRPRVLLGMKKRGFGEGKLNGFGGKVEAGESIKQAALREMEEESGLRVTDAEKCGEILFEFKDDPVLLEVHVFRASEVEDLSALHETEEMAPQWFECDAIPFHRMWADDKFWFPYLLNGIPFKAFFKFDGHSTILEHTIEEVAQYKDV